MLSLDISDFPPLLGQKVSIIYRVGSYAKERDGADTMGMADDGRSFADYLLAVGSTSGTIEEASDIIAMTKELIVKAHETVPQITVANRKASLINILSRPNGAEFDAHIVIAHGAQFSKGPRASGFEMDRVDFVMANEDLLAVRRNGSQANFTRGTSVFLVICAAGGEAGGEWYEASIPGAYIRLGASIVIAAMSAVSLGASLKMLEKLLPSACQDGITTCEAYAKLLAQQEGGLLQNFHDNLYAPFLKRTLPSSTQFTSVISPSNSIQCY